MTDNATNNDTMIKEVSRRLKEDSIDYDPTLHRLRCNGHIINLAVRSFLHGQENQRALFKKIEKSEEWKTDDAEMAEWRNLGTLGRVHNVVYFITKTPQRLQTFRKLPGNEDGLSLKRDNKTRWNSWYLMLDWLLKDNIRAAVDAYCAREKQVERDRLSYSDWENMTKIRNFLKTFFEITKETEGRESTLDQILQAMDFLLYEFENNQKLYKNQGDEYMISCLDAGWTKMKKYYKNTDRSVAYLAANGILRVCLGTFLGYVCKA